MLRLLLRFNEPADAADAADAAETEEAEEEEEEEEAGLFARSRRRTHSCSPGTGTQ